MLEEQKQSPPLPQSDTMDEVTQEKTTSPDASPPNTGKGVDFWLSFIAIIASVLLSALDLTAVSTALPTITRALNGEDDFTWVGSAYALSSTAILPLSGSLADIFGRRYVIMIFIAIFALGSALAGSAQNMSWMIAARSE